MASHLLAAVTGNFVPRNKAVVGENAFAHEAGIHQHGVLASRETYEIMKPEDVGVVNSQLVLGKHSGKHAVVDRARAMGYELEGTGTGRGDGQRSRNWPTAKSVFSIRTSKPSSPAARPAPSGPGHCSG